MSDTPIKIETNGHILEVTIDRPKANAIDLATSRIMGEVFRDFRDDPSLRVAILTARNEKFFCPGWDLKAVQLMGTRWMAITVSVDLGVCKSCAG